MATLATNSHTV